jgi:branched-chain amino acid transport system ATP-binding protein
VIVMPLLTTKQLSKRFGSLQAVYDVDLEINEGRVYSIIGPNGAGKTTLFNLISGHLEPSGGDVRFKDRRISGLKPHQISHLGIGRSFQLNNLFPALSVFENVRLAVQSRHSSRFDLFRHVRRYRSIDRGAEGIVEKIGLSPSSDKEAQFLSHGDKRLLEIGIALATHPVLLLMDEPTSGMAPEETIRMIDFIKKLAEELTIILIEHKMNVVMTISDRVIVMHQGMVIARGNPAEVQAAPEVKRAYLGGMD